MAEKKYIDSEKVIKLLRKDLICKVPPSFSYGLFVAADEVAKMDGEDVRPVKRGELVYLGVSLDRETGEEYPVYFCSECGAMNYVGNQNFCFFCGADMRPKEDNDG